MISAQRSSPFAERISTPARPPAREMLTAGDASRWATVPPYRSDHFRHVSVDGRVSQGGIERQRALIEFPDVQEHAPRTMLPRPFVRRLHQPAPDAAPPPRHRNPKLIDNGARLWHLK